MKWRPFWLAVPAIACVCSSCDRKETPAASGPAAASEAGKPQAPPEPPALTADERAAKFGIVKHLPKDIEGVVSFYNGSKTAERFKKTHLWALLNDEAGAPADEAADKPDEAAADASGPGLYLGQEFFLATGKGSAEQLGNLSTFNRRYNYFHLRAIAKALAAAAKNGGEESLKQSLSENFNEEILSGLVKDPESGVGLIERAQFPPLYVGFKVKPEKSQEIEQQLTGALAMMGMLGEMAVPVEFERGGGKFSGFRIIGEQVAKTIGQDRAKMDEALEVETADRLLAAIAKKDLVVATGKVGDYVVLFLGSKPEDCQLVAEAKDSLAAGDALRFADGYVSKDLAALSYGDRAMIDTCLAASGRLSELAQGFGDGLAGSEGLGDTQDLQALLQVVAEREQALRKMASADAYGVVAFYEDGLKLESFGGIDRGALDWKSPSRLAGLGASPDVVLFANATSDAAYDEKARAYVESLVETAYAVTMKFAKAPISDPDLLPFQQGAKVFDEKFRPDVVALLDALRGDLSAGLGKECAVVVDLKGTVPPVPGVSQALADKGRFLRASWIAPVTDRAKLQESWGKVNGAAANLLKKAGEMAGSEIPMQKPMSSEKDGFVTWFFSMPFFNDDFVPSVTLGDQWFVASTSKVQALELAKAAGKGGDGPQGMSVSVKFDPLHQFGQEWLTLVDQNAESIFGIGSPGLEKFRDAKPDIEKGLKVMEDVESLTIQARRENGRLRGSVHLKTH